MPIFNRAQVREYLLSDFGVRRELAEEISIDRARGWLTGHSLSYIGSAIECILTDLVQPATWLLEKAHRWLIAAITDSEPSPFSPLRNEWLAQCNWLLTGVHDVENLRKAVHSTDQHYSAEGWSNEVTDLVLPLYCDAGEFERGCEIFENYADRDLPVDFREIDNQGSMAYLLCLNRSSGKYTDDQARVATERYLTRAVPEFLGHGQYLTLALWMKLVTWNKHESREAAWESLLRCYDFMPGANSR